MQALQFLQLNCSDPLHALSKCKKYSEITVGKRTQWKPAVFAVKRFAVHWVEATRQGLESGRGIAHKLAIGGHTIQTFYDSLASQIYISFE